MRGEGGEAGADEVEFCRAWELVYAAIRAGPLAVAEIELSAFLAKYPEDSIARYHKGGVPVAA